LEKDSLKGERKNSHKMQNVEIPKNVLDVCATCQHCWL